MHLSVVRDFFCQRINICGLISKAVNLAVFTTWVLTLLCVGDKITKSLFNMTSVEAAHLLTAAAPMSCTIISLDTYTSTRFLRVVYM